MRRVLCAVLFFPLANCGHAAAVQTGRGFSVFRVHRVQVYVSPAFPRELEGDPVPPAILQSIQAVETLFRRGILTGEMFLHALDSPHTESPVRQVYRRSLESVDEALAEDPGPLMKLLNCKDLSAPDKPITRLYDLWVTFDASETGWGSFHHFELLVENRKATTRTTAQEFMESAHVVRLRYAGMEI